MKKNIMDVRIRILSLKLYHRPKTLRIYAFQSHCMNKNFLNSTLILSWLKPSSSKIDAFAIPSMMSFFYKNLWSIFVLNLLVDVNVFWLRSLYTIIFFLSHHHICIIVFSMLTLKIQVVMHAYSNHVTSCIIFSSISLLLWNISN